MQENQILLETTVICIACHFLFTKRIHGRTKKLSDGITHLPTFGGPLSFAMNMIVLRNKMSSVALYISVSSGALVLRDGKIFHVSRGAQLDDEVHLHDQFKH